MTTKKMHTSSSKDKPFSPTPYQPSLIFKRVCVIIPHECPMSRGGRWLTAESRKKVCPSASFQARNDDTSCISVNLIQQNAKINENYHPTPNP